MTTDTKMRIAHSFKELLLAHPFEKITIKKITDRVGIIRPTFYTYFHDKYEIFEYILQEELMQHLFAFVKNDLEDEAFKMLFHYFAKNGCFYEKAFQVEGQNSFEEILTQQLYRLFLSIIEKRGLNIDEENQLLTKENLALFYSKKVITILQFWIVNQVCALSEVDQVYQASSILFNHSLNDLLK